MKLTTKGRYAVMAMADLALFQNDKPVSLHDISLRQNISLSYFEQWFSNLKNCKLVKSVRGPSGGYILEKNPKEIKLSNIIFAVDEKVKTAKLEPLIFTSKIWKSIGNWGLYSFK